MPRQKDMWRCGIIDRSARQLAAESARGASVAWLPEEPSFAFLADPFGAWDEDSLHVFVERYDYRERHGTIERLTYDRGVTLVERISALVEPWHLSYPFVFEGDGAVWMLPEAHRSGELSLYRAHGRYDDWRRECSIALDCVPVDASIIRYHGRWWLFYASAADKASKLDELRVAWAHDLLGPWTTHPGNPVRRDRTSSRPGGTPFVLDGVLMLPVQDCSRTYGGAIRLLRIDQLDDHTFAAHAGEPLERPAGSPPDAEGMHTFSACGPVTLVDVKTVDRSLWSLRVELGRMLGRRAAR